jgi:hypothetical protein
LKNKLYNKSVINKIIIWSCLNEISEFLKYWLKWEKTF